MHQFQWEQYLVLNKLTVVHLQGRLSASTLGHCLERAVGQVTQFLPRLQLPHHLLPVLPLHQVLLPTHLLQVI